MPRGSPRRPLRFARVPHPLMSQPCIVPISHKPDEKGYVRVVPRTAEIGARARPLHRTAYLAKHGPNSIPPGWEIDHICRNRACCNRRHLRALSCSDHKRITGMQRYADRLEEAFSHWCYYRPSAVELAKIFEVKPGTAEGWIAKWRSEFPALAQQSDKLSNTTEKQ